jgi:multiple sugar transport system ATP-binding protein
VGGFIGSPAMNMLDAQIEQRNGDLRATIGEQTISLGQETISQRPALKAYAGQKVIIGIRPEDLEDAAVEGGAPPDRILKGRLELREALGSEIMAHFAIKAAHAETDETAELAADAGTTEGPQIGVEENEAVVVGRFSPRSRVRDGDDVSAVVDTRALHFFDPETGAGIYDEPPRKGDTT